MTVCIASRTYGAVFGISDRMVTSGDIQFEPSAQKMHFLTSSIAIMASGDLSFHTEILSEVNRIVLERIKAQPNVWISVKEVVDLYISERNTAKLKRAESEILSPLNLNRISYLTTQKVMDSDLVDKIAQELINFRVPDVSTIVMGVDQIGDNILPHIYTIQNNYISCDDSIGFSAIGSGSRHAESQFMLARHAWNSNTAETLLLTYSAKKDSEIAPGVGEETDMFMIGPGLGSAVKMNNETMGKLDNEYQKLKKARHQAQQDAMAEMRRFVDELGKATTAAQAEKPIEGGGKASD